MSFNQKYIRELTEDYYKGPRAIFRMDIPQQSKLIYIYIASCAERFHPSHVTIGKFVGMSEDSVKKYLEPLFAGNILKAGYQARGKRKNFRKTYSIVPIDQWTAPMLPSKDKGLSVFQAVTETTGDPSPKPTGTDTLPERGQIPASSRDNNELRIINEMNEMNEKASEASAHSNLNSESHRSGDLKDGILGQSASLGIAHPPVPPTPFPNQGNVDDRLVELRKRISISLHGKAFIQEIPDLISQFFRENDVSLGPDPSIWFESVLSERFRPSDPNPKFHSIRQRLFGDMLKAYKEATQARLLKTPPGCRDESWFKGLPVNKQRTCHYFAKWLTGMIDRHKGYQYPPTNRIPMEVEQFFSGKGIEYLVGIEWPFITEFLNRFLRDYFNDKIGVGLLL